MTEDTDVTVIERAEAAAETGLMKLIARGAMVLVLPVIGFIASVFWSEIQELRREGQAQNIVAVASVKDTNADLKEFKTDVSINFQAQEDKLNLVASRVTVVETNQERARNERREREQRSDEMWRQQQEAFRLMQQQLSTLTAQVSALTATVEALKVSIDRRADLGVHDRNAFR
jgi:hypothetical protein